MQSYTTTAVYQQPSQQLLQQPLEEQSEQPLQPPVPQTVPQTAPQPRDYFQRTPPVFQSSGLAAKVPFELRANPLVDRNHPDFMRIERYFFTLLRNTNLTLQEILDNTFEPHEIDILEPASHPPELVKLQKANSIRYQQILDTRFKGNVPTLQLKLTFLYFGLPIAPMKPGASQTLVITDLDFLEDKVQIATDPLGFLNEYAERAYGDPHKHVPDRHFLQLPPTQEFTSLRIRPQPYDDLSALRLRGGALPLKMDWEPERDDTSEPPTISIRIFGYQGSILVQVHSSAYESFVEAVDQLLGMRYKYNYSIRLQIWHQNGSDTEPVAQATGMIYQKNKRPSGVDDIYSLVEKLFSRDNEDGKYCGFVCFDKEESPESYKPSYEVDRQIIRVWDNDKKNMAYMKIPNYEYLRAMRVLFPKSPHTYFRFSANGEEITYGLLDPPRVVWDKVIQDHTTEDGLPLLSFGRIAVPDDAVPVFVPGFHSYDTDFSGGFPVTSLSRDDLKLDGGDDEKAGLSKLISAVNAANPFAISNKKKIGIEVWIPGDEFSNSLISGQFINLVGTEINEQTIYNWKTAVRRYQGPRIHAEPGKISIAARPVFSTYTISAKNDPKRQFSIDLNDIKLSEFKEEVKSKLFPRYQLTSKNLALHLVQSTWSTNRIDFAVTVDTDENGWRWIVRHITEPDITISLEYWVSSWAIEKGSTWGPRYDTTEPFTLTSQFDSTNKDFAPYDPPVRRLFEESKNNLDGAVRAQKLRERLFWDSTSMFASPTKPALPLQGPPIETLIRTGPNVPAFTTAMRTPSEVARLEREVHTLRGNILDRVRECPYKDCGQIFRFQDGSKLDRHLREDHTTLQCFLCDKEKHLLRFYDTQSIRQHFLDKHYNSIKEELLGVSGDQEHGIGEPRYCNRCGRDQTVLNNPTDKAYHNSPSIEPEPAEPPLPWREATTSDPLPSRRSSSPPWDEFLEPQSEPWAFYPEADWRCSRCFRAAGKSMDHIEMHMYEKGSCRIRRTLGTTTYGPVPNRSGWILPDEKFDFRTAYYKFVSEYPAYQHTMFPVRKESIKSVWEDPYTLKNATGSIEDDPNYTRLKYTETPGDELPWPPYKGLAIPLNGPEPEPDSPKVKIFVPVDKEESEKVNKDDSKGIEELDEELDEEQEKLADPEELDSNSKVTIPPEDNILASTEEDDSSLVTSSSEFEESDESEQSAEIDEDYDPTKQPAETGDELEEEYSERSAVEDPIQELETVPPEKSKKRATPITPPFDAEDRTSWPSVKKRVVPPPPEVKAEPIPINLDPPSPHGIDYVPWITPQPIKSPRSEKKRIQLPEWDPVISVPPIWDEMNELARKFGRGSQPPLMKPFISSEPHFKRSASGPPSARPQTRGKDSFGKGRK
ncbi:uncharacterized protein F4817DRAFT_358897 [Daldinia loculata]|uniref:uncharacterized protein n=1 Tax=Daldinia loculata TaxID=103429 RepID=UPI0020C3024B|nr:uncharacterized protein F4817DRAFT_358897 [Daldinia loculata]KAI1647017.1 hypothetical protein F4817DRAFT_358897 [Daldinia loculata]